MLQYSSSHNVTHRWLNGKRNTSLLVLVPEQQVKHFVSLNKVKACKLRGLLNLKIVFKTCVRCKPTIDIYYTD